jgi:hypothetical protein
MEWFSTLSLALGTAWTSGINLYATVTVLGLLQKFAFTKLPGGLEVLDNWWIIGIAGFLYAVEFFADKIPYIRFGMSFTRSSAFRRAQLSLTRRRTKPTRAFRRLPLCSAAVWRFLRTAQKRLCEWARTFRPNRFPIGFCQSSKTLSLLSARFSPCSRPS